VHQVQGQVCPRAGLVIGADLIASDGQAMTDLKSRIRVV
jgi:hypothetical protein